MCAKMIVNAGITKVYIGGEYPDEFALEVLNTAGVPLILVPRPTRAVEAAEAVRADAIAAVENPLDKA
jgi:deoxycytidylate deaminase